MTDSQDEWTTVAVLQSDKDALDRINEIEYSSEASYRRILLDLVDGYEQQVADVPKH